MTTPTITTNQRAEIIRRAIACEERLTAADLAARHGQTLRADLARHCAEYDSIQAFSVLAR